MNPEKYSSPAFAIPGEQHESTAMFDDFDREVLLNNFGSPEQRAETLLKMTTEGLMRQAEWIAQRCHSPRVESALPGVVLTIAGVDLAPGVRDLANAPNGSVKYVAPKDYSPYAHTNMLDAARSYGVEGDMETAATAQWLDIYLTHRFKAVNRQTAAFVYSLYTRGFSGSAEDVQFYDAIANNGAEGLPALGFNQDIGFIAEAFVSETIARSVSHNGRHDRLLLETGDIFGGIEGDATDRLAAFTLADIQKVYADDVHLAALDLPDRVQAMLLEHPFNALLMTRTLLDQDSYDGDTRAFDECLITEQVTDANGEVRDVRAINMYQAYRYISQHMVGGINYKHMAIKQNFITDIFEKFMESYSMDKPMLTAQDIVAGLRPTPPQS